MKTFPVTITEKLELTVQVEAQSRAAAELITEAKWRKGEYVLGADNFTGVDFHARLPERMRGKTRADVPER